MENKRLEIRLDERTLYNLNYCFEKFKENYPKANFTKTQIIKNALTFLCVNLENGNFSVVMEENNKRIHERLFKN